MFADLCVKSYTYLKQNDPAQAFCGVVLFASRGLEPSGLAPYQPLLDANVIRRFYLDEIPELANAPLGMSVLYLIAQTEEQAPATARTLIARAKSECGDEALRADLIELIETVIIYKLRQLTREEIQTMLQVHDIRESKVYQEALAEGKVEGKEEGIAFAIAKMAARKMSAEDIATILDLDVEAVRRALSKNAQK
ncbi:MAG TPA: DUF2887 domain-containing protein [Gemmataceae bacterium]|nr:DUF2887 domain-containing protein [Gemmataceae bacterium]